MSDACKITKIELTTKDGKNIDLSWIRYDTVLLEELALLEEAKEL